MPSSTASTVSKKTVRKAAPKITLGQTDLATLLRDSKSTRDATEKMLALLTRTEKQPSQIVVQSLAGEQPAPIDQASARLEALLTLLSGRSAQQVLQDMLDADGPPTREEILRVADRLVAAR